MNHNLIKQAYVKKNLKMSILHHCLYACKYGGTAHILCNLKYELTRKIHMVVHNGANYDFFKNKLSEELEEQFECLRDNTEKHLTSKIP